MKHKYTCVNCGYKGESKKEAYWMEICPECNQYVGFKPCPINDIGVN